ncbi:MAG: DUF3592 domain-containing protein [Acidovorax sp.]|nr:MAG: DUF3592 domain-containing protein [Acidovorax sp.]
MPFAVAGMGIFWFMVASPLYEWARMQTWKQVPAVVESATLQSHHGSKGSIRFSVSVRYRYEVGGVTYTGQRATIYERPDNIGSFQEQLGRRLERAQRSGTPVRVWVNPARPTESIADRSLRPGLLAVALGFAVFIGGLVCLVLVLVVRKVWGGSRGATAL